jgi:hypothetical protein
MGSEDVAEPIKTTMKLSLLLCLLLLSCSREPTVKKPIITITTVQGTFELIRPEGKPNAAGAVDIALWAKEGVSTNDYVYMRTKFADGTDHFTRMLP